VLFFRVLFQDEQILVAEHQIRPFIKLREHMQRLIELQRSSLRCGVSGCGLLTQGDQFPDFANQRLVIHRAIRKSRRHQHRHAATKKEAEIKHYLSS
jgi:hypothetical protein